jgi:hypothetical protein
MENDLVAERKAVLDMKEGAVGGPCDERRMALDELCAWAEELRTTSDRVRAALENDNLADIASAREEFDRIRDRIVNQARRLASHRSEHG